MSCESCEAIDDKPMKRLIFIHELFGEKID